MLFAQVVKVRKYPQSQQSLRVEFEETMMEFTSLLYFSETSDIGTCSPSLTLPNQFYARMEQDRH